MLTARAIVGPDRLPRPQALVAFKGVSMDNVLEFSRDAARSAAPRGTYIDVRQDPKTPRWRRAKLDQCSRAAPRQLRSPLERLAPDPRREGRGRNGERRWQAPNRIGTMAAGSFDPDRQAMEPPGV